MPLVVACPESAYPPRVPLGMASMPEADLGTAVHAILADWIRHGRERSGASGTVPLEAHLPGVNLQEALMLARMGWQQWSRLAPHFPSPQIERELTFASGEISSAHPDIYSMTDGVLRIADFKTGRDDSNYEPQLRTYALLLLEQHPEIESIWAAILWIREGEIEAWEWSPAEILDWWSQLQLRRSGDESFRPGVHCGYCRRLHECPGGLARLREAARTFAVPANKLLDGHQPDMKHPLVIGQVYESIRLLRPRLEAAAEFIKAHVQAAGGRVVLGDGRELVLTEQVQRRINPVEAWTILAEQFGEEELRRMATLPRGKIEDAVRAGAPRGQKGEAVENLMNRLDSAEALDVLSVTQLRLRRSLPQIAPPKEELTSGQTGSNAKCGSDSSPGRGSDASSDASSDHASGNSSNGGNVEEGGLPAGTGHASPGRGAGGDGEAD